MIIRIGNFLFRYRNGLFPLVYLLVLVESRPLLPDYAVAAVVGFGVALLGQGLRAVTIGLEYIIRGGRKRNIYAKKLVQGGVFAHCRNPLYVGNFLVIAGIGIASNSLAFCAIAIPFFAIAYGAIIAAEENFLRGKFGSEFDDYCARVNRLIPRFAGLGRTLSGMRFNWRRLITAEYGSTYIWVGGMILIVLRNIWRHGDAEAGRVWVWGLGLLLALVTVAYALARYLKKSGRLEVVALTK